MRAARSRSAEPEPVDELLEAHEQLSKRIEAVLTTAHWTPAKAADLRRLHDEQRGLVREHLGPSARAYVRVRDAVARLSQLGAVSEIIQLGAVEAAEAADLDRVLLSRVEDGALVARG